MKVRSTDIQQAINKDAKIIFESLNTDEAKTLFNLATSLYKEIEKFEKDAPAAAINALSPHLKHVHEMVTQILKNPMTYVSEIQGEQPEVSKVQTVSMSPTKK